MGFADLLSSVSTWLEVLTNKGVRGSQKQTAKVNAVDVKTNGQNDKKGKGGTWAKKAAGPASPEGSQQREKCAICATMHPTEKCNILAQMTPDERLLNLGQKRCCFACLEQGHIRKMCPKFPEGERPTCASCGRGHNTLLCGSTTQYHGNRQMGGRQPRPDTLPFRPPSADNRGQQHENGQNIAQGANPAGGQGS